MFSHGPFIFSHGGIRGVNSTPHRVWSLHYGAVLLSEKNIKGTDLKQPEVIEAFADEISNFIGKMRQEHGADTLYLIDSETDKTVASIEVESYPALGRWIVDDSSRYWLRTADKLSALDVTLDDFARISATHSAPHLHWVAGLLPSEVLTTNPGEWRPPTPWEIRHIVGEGSFSGLSGAKAAELVGIMPQGFRKYTAADDAKSRQNISFAMWHLLLHRLGVQKIRGAA